jgi:ATP-dependent DNA helicase RecG
MDLVEHVGSGMKRIRDAMQEYGLPLPYIEANEHWFSMTFTRRGLEKGLEKGVRKAKLRILAILQDYPHRTIGELATELNIGERRVRQHLADLKVQGLLLRIGPDKGGHWEVVGKK